MWVRSLKDRTLANFCSSVSGSAKDRALADLFSSDFGCEKDGALVNFLQAYSGLRRTGCSRILFRAFFCLAPGAMLGECHLRM